MLKPGDTVFEIGKLQDTNNYLRPLSLKELWTQKLMGMKISGGSKTAKELCAEALLKKIYLEQKSTR